MTRIKVLTVAGLLAYSIIIVLPPIIHGYVYPNLGDDSGGILAVLDSMQRGIIRPAVQYFGYIMFGYPMVFLSSLTHIDIDVIYLWFSSLALIGVGVTLYIVVSRLVSRQAGFLALVLVIFASQGILFQFYYGQIFNLINMGIILPCLMFFTAKYIAEGRRIQLIPVIFFIILFGGFHTSGVYLPFVTGVAMLCYIIYGRIRKRKIEKRIVLLGSVIVVFSFVSFVVLVFIPTFSMLMKYYDYPGKVLWESLTSPLGIPIDSYFMSIVSITILVAFALVMVYAKEIWRNLYPAKTKVYILLLSTTVIVLAIVVFGNLSTDPWRQALDLATVFALLIAILLGILLKYQRTNIVVITILFAVAFGLFHNLPTWFGYNSAIRPVDLQALAYADNFKTYSCSGMVAPQIYSRFTESEWVTEHGDILIVRSAPMTPRSDPENIWYDRHGVLPDDSYTLSKVFSDDEVSIEVYRKVKE